MTFIVRGTRCEDATTAVRLRADTAVAKARDLIGIGWQVTLSARMVSGTISMTSTICSQTLGVIARCHCDKLRATLVLPSDTHSGAPPPTDATSVYYANGNWLQ